MVTDKDRHDLVCRRGGEKGGDRIKDGEKSLRRGPGLVVAEKKS